MTVNMPVEVLNERCAHCPELDVNTITEANHVVEKMDEDGKIHQKDLYENRLRCANVEKCTLLSNLIFTESVKLVDGDAEEQKPRKTRTTAKPAKTAATRKKQATK